jgi:hypothetical protein
MKKLGFILLTVFLVSGLFADNWKWGIGFDKFTISSIVMEKKISEKVIISPTFYAKFGDTEEYSLGLIFSHPIPIYLTDFYVGTGLFYNQSDKDNENGTYCNIPIEVAYYKNVDIYRFKVGVKATGLDLRGGKVSHKVKLFWVFFW